MRPATDRRRVRTLRRNVSPTSSTALVGPATMQVELLAMRAQQQRGFDRLADVIRRAHAEAEHLIVGRARLEAR